MGPTGRVTPSQSGQASGFDSQTCAYGSWLNGATSRYPSRTYRRNASTRSVRVSSRSVAFPSARASRSSSVTIVVPAPEPLDPVATKTRMSGHPPIAMSATSVATLFVLRFPRPRGCSWVPVKVLAGPVVGHRGSRVDVSGGDLDVAQIDARKHGCHERYLPSILSSACSWGVSQRHLLASIHIEGSTASINAGMRSAAPRQVQLTCVGYCLLHVTVYVPKADSGLRGGGS